MRKQILISILVFIAISSLSYSHTISNSTRSIAFGNSKPGFLNTTELNSGIGLFAINRDYSKKVANLTTILGVGLTKNLTAGIGIGLSLYNGGTLVPLFADFRYFFNLGKTRFFVLGEGGTLLNSANTEGGTKYFVSPGAGIILPVSNNLYLNSGAGLFTQFRKEDKSHDSFANIKLGITYLFKSKKN